MIGSSHTPCGVCSSIAEGTLSTSISSNTVSPCCLPPITSAALQKRVIRKYESELREALVNFGVDPALKSLPWLGDADEEEVTEALLLSLLDA